MAIFGNDSFGGFVKGKIEHLSSNVDLLVAVESM